MIAVAPYLSDGMNVDDASGAAPVASVPVPNYATPVPAPTYATPSAPPPVVVVGSAPGSTSAPVPSGAPMTVPQSMVLGGGDYNPGPSSIKLSPAPLPAISTQRVVAPSGVASTDITTSGVSFSWSWLAVAAVALLVLWHKE